MDQFGQFVPDAADILLGNYIRYDRMYEMTKFAFYGKTDSNDVNIYIDVYSLVRSLYNRGSNIQIQDSYVIASSIINLAIHLRAYFETRHRCETNIYIIYGGARPKEAFVNCPYYNSKNILTENSNVYLSELIRDNLAVMEILCAYLHHIYCIVNYEMEFNVLAGMTMDMDTSGTPNVVYSKDPLCYQLVAYKSKTFLFRPKKSKYEDISWVVTKSTLYDAYRYGELALKKERKCSLDVKLFSTLQAICGVKSRSLKSLKNTNTTVGILEVAVNDGIFTPLNRTSIFYDEPTTFESYLDTKNINYVDMACRFNAIDLNNQTSLYSNILVVQGIKQSIIDLYNPQEVRNINDRYFTRYPLDLNRV